MGVVLRLIRSLNDALGITSIVVTHDVRRDRADRRRRATSCPKARSWRAARRRSCATIRRRSCTSSWTASPTGRCRSTIRRPTITSSCSRGGAHDHALAARAAAELRSAFLERVGALSRFFAARCSGRLPPALLRPRLVVEQIYNAGALSLVIIMTCGLFVGMVLGLQGYDLLQRFGSEDSLGTGAALGAAQGTRAGRHGAAVRRPCRHGARLRDRPDARHRPARRRWRSWPSIRCAASSLPRFLGGVIAMPLLSRDLHRRSASSACSSSACSSSASIPARSGRRCASAVELGDVREGLIKGCVFGVACSLIAVYEGYNAEPTAEGVGRATTRTVVDLRRADADPRLHAHGRHAVTREATMRAVPRHRHIHRPVRAARLRGHRCSWSRRSRTASSRSATRLATACRRSSRTSAA